MPRVLVVKSGGVIDSAAALVFQFVHGGPEEADELKGCGDGGDLSRRTVILDRYLGHRHGGFTTSCDIVRVQAIRPIFPPQTSKEQTMNPLVIRCTVLGVVAMGTLGCGDEPLSPGFERVAVRGFVTYAGEWTEGSVIIVGMTQAENVQAAQLNPGSHSQRYSVRADVRPEDCDNLQAWLWLEDPTGTPAISQRWDLPGCGSYEHNFAVS